MSTRPPSMRDVASRAGVSLSTVSRVMRGAPGVAPQVRERVRNAADELSYVVSRNASGLVTGRTGRVSVVVPYLKPWFFGSVLAGISEVLREADLDMLVYQVGDLRPQPGWTRTLPLRRNCDAVITVSMDLSEEECHRLDDVGVPLVLTGQRVPGRASVFIDDQAGAAGATRHLLNLGHTRIAYIGSRGDSWYSGSSMNRLRGYQAAMGKAGLTPWSLIKPPGHEGGEHAMGELLSDLDPPTAVLAEFDDIAMGAHRALRRSGIGVPEAISLMGFDNHEGAAILDLTTVDQSPADIGAAAGRLAVEITEGTRPRDTHLEMPTQIIPRQSTSAPRSVRGLS
ncbi:MAG: LacI family DNA-binding transcriptional regulator [Nocardiopsis sp. BM-2018]|uniref:DNA-binding LacI/PurR family transcriptional regulator n=1 Tax=Nocardiopsis metallicus TaxID=179819 RepID=A0A840WPR5_9ACTN|nr:LacI family DNA-binding transcriptional regulator [Nocardiopsis metallicus]MBB5492108.1 DNA-binding LacI/PurR family transcriptional regulator [Nocardiopsis metallicus]QRN80350.1 MAG: LacI family DNA-binding transcriptional regulator [Nocardiopsis sp. BM-2018]